MCVQDVIQALQLSALAYKDIQPVFPDGQLTVINDPVSEVQCYLRKSGNVLSITFRGSNSEKDWKTNLTFWKKTIPYGNTASPIRVHTGFLKAYKTPAVRGKIHSMITDDIFQIRITGHSHGAALAILCGVDLEYNFPARDYEVIVFGAPRIGNRAFATSYNKRVFKTLRVENGNDIVTKVPFAAWGYRHVGIPIHTGAPRIPGVFSCEDHRPQSYYSHLFTQFAPQGCSQTPERQFAG